MEGELFILALLPLLFLVASILYFHLNLAKAAQYALLITALLAYGVWYIIPNALLASGLKGFFVTFDVLLIIFGALVFMRYCEKTDRFKTIQHLLGKIHSSKRVQTIILAFFFVAFIEGLAGFGTPAAIVVPLLVAFGIQPVYAIAIALLGDTIPVMFGAVGTPIRTGFSGIETVGVAHTAAWLSAPLLIIIPLLMLYLLKKSQFDIHQKDVPYRKLIPFSLLCSFSFLIPFIGLSYIVPELASILSAIIGMTVIGFTSYNGWLLHDKKKSITRISSRLLFSAVFPYLVFIALLLVGKLFPLQYVIQLPAGVSHVFNLFNPGLVFFATIAITSAIYRENAFSRKMVSSVMVRLKNPAIVLLSLAIMVQLFILTGINTSSLPAMGEIIAQALENGALWIISPFIGVIGAFLSGSATVSNLLFGVIQFDAAVYIGLSTTLILSLQLIGGSVGNMVAISNIVAAESVIGKHNLERDVLLLTAPICLVLVLVLVGTVGIALLLGLV